MVKVQFQNPQGSEHVKVYWLSYEGKEILYHTLRPGVMVDQSTGVGHEWIVRHAETNRFIAKFTAQEYETTFVFPKVKRAPLAINTRIPVTFKNKSKSREVKIFWVNFEKTETFYAALKPGQKWGVSTYVGHQWVLRDSKTNNIVMEVAGTQKDQEIIIPKDFVGPVENTTWLEPKNNYDYKTMEIAGVKIHYTPEVMDTHGDKWVNWMTESIEQVKKVVPQQAWDVMGTTEVYVNNQFYVDGKLKSGAVANWSKGWLEAKGNLPEKAGHVEIYNMGDVMDWSSWQPYIMLHEFTHTFQWRHGHAGSEIKELLEETYNRAMADKKYDNVENYWGNMTKHYGTTNYTEYFAECTEAFFSQGKFKNDLYPFNHDQLKEFDQDGYQLVAKAFGIEDPDQYFACLNKTDECKAKEEEEEEQKTLSMNLNVLFQGTEDQINKLQSELLGDSDKTDDDLSLGFDLGRLPNFQKEEDILADFNISTTFGQEWFLLDNSAPQQTFMLP